MTGNETANPAGVEDDTENRFSPGPADQRNQATLRHPERSTYRCFLTDLAGFIDICRAGPDYADRQDRKKTGLFRSFYSLAEHPHFTPALAKCQADFLLAHIHPGVCRGRFIVPIAD